MSGITLQTIQRHIAGVTILQNDFIRLILFTSDTNNFSVFTLKIFALTLLLRVYNPYFFYGGGSILKEKQKRYSWQRYQWFWFPKGRLRKTAI